MNDFKNWSVNHVSKNAAKSANKIFKNFKKEVMGLFKKDKSFTLSEKSFGKAYQSFRVEGSGTDVDAFFEKNKDKLMDLIESKLHDLGSAKIQTTTWIEWIKEEESKVLEQISMRSSKRTKTN